jgi:putative MFS transporter
VVSDGGRIADLFAGSLGRRTAAIWLANLSASMVLYGLSGWLPTLYLTHFKLPLGTALAFGLAGTAAGLPAAIIGALLINRVSRRMLFILGFAVSALLLAGLGLRGAALTAQELVVIGPLAMMGLSMLISCSYVHMPETYPTQIRAMGVGVGSSWIRLGSIVGPVLIGAVLARASLNAMFLVFAAIVACGLAAPLLAMRPPGSAEAGTPK